MASQYKDLPEGVANAILSINGDITPAQIITGGIGISVATVAGTTTITNTSPGSGDVVGPASSTDNALARFDGTTGKLIQNSNAILTDTGNLTLAGVHYAPNGTQGIPSYSFTSSTGSGFYITTTPDTYGFANNTDVTFTVGRGTSNTLNQHTLTFYRCISFEQTVQTLDADNQVVSPSAIGQTTSHFNLDSDDPVATNRTFTIGDPFTVGQFLIITFDAGGNGNLAQLLNTGNVQLSSDWLPTSNDSLTLMWGGNYWIEISRKNPSPAVALTNTHIFVGNASNVATDVALSGAATISNAGVLTLATVNSNVGTFGSSSQVGTFTVTAKGLITAASNTTIDHNALSNLTVGDVHTQYAFLTGRASGQTLVGGTAASENLTLNSTSNATKGLVKLVADGGSVTVGGGATASELRLLEASGSGTNYTGFVAPALAGNVVYTLPTADGAANTSLQTNGSTVLSWVAAEKAWTVSTITANPNPGVDHVTYLCDSSGGAFNFTLPAPVSNLRLQLKCKTGSCLANPVTIVRNGSEKIEGTAASYTFNTNWGSLLLISDGTDWFFI